MSAELLRLVSASGQRQQRNYACRIGNVTRRDWLTHKRGKPTDAAIDFYPPLTVTAWHTLASTEAHVSLGQHFNSRSLSHTHSFEAKQGWLTIMRPAPPAGITWPATDHKADQWGASGQAQSGGRYLKKCFNGTHKILTTTGETCNAAEWEAMTLERDGHWPAHADRLT